ncbi:hypothetical protein L3Q82_001119 [Scortum barcoo]|uniref:Uncharacterized protein n=1 Tax=Scortum barcoo TaxID=214431 RepID=A0ACB8WAB0_9TELE|nr:hypothetical protein L3Q82_001119 [Scortum barcoo]
MPPGRLPREVFQACPTGRRPPGKTQDTLERLCLSTWPGNASGIPPEELEEVSGLCNLLKRALSYNMIEKNFYTLGRWWKKRFHRHRLQRTTGNLHGGAYLLLNLSSRRRRRKRGSRARVLVLRKRENRPPLPSILLANVQSLDNKLDELRSRMAFQRDIKNCNVLVFTETWLDPSIPDSAIVPEGLYIHRQDRTINSGKSKGGGVCFMVVNNKWCSDAWRLFLRAFLRTWSTS